MHPETIERIERLDLRARYLVEGFLAGRHRSPYFGQSVEFLQHRQYVPGDDLRHVDWKVWAKQDRYYVKQYEEDTNLRCTLLVDVSASMQYGSGPFNKYEYAATIAACLAYLLLKRQDAVGCMVFDEVVRRTVPQHSKRSHLDSVLGALAGQQPRQKTNLYHVLSEAADSHPQRGMMVVVSDLLADTAGTLKGLKLLRQRKHDVLVFHVLDDDELDFPFNGPTRFDGLEQAMSLNCNPRALRQGYLEALHTFLDELRLGCATHTIDYALLRTSAPLDAALARFLSNRLGMHHRN
ncbi:MAG: hypothetical protein A2W31_13880 [Planctomycetes bacterium RBG_16_64_10]|nr:MAG: hypothetical protein A2W31_13880 [Planctomycetes bacterium RBG_16_64_10]